MKKRFIACLLALVLVLVLSVPALAEVPSDPDPDDPSAMAIVQTQLVTATVNGRPAYALWNCTYGKWIIPPWNFVN